MAVKQLPDIALMRQLLGIDPATGAMTWRPRDAGLFRQMRGSAEHAAAVWNARYAWSRAFTAINTSGYHYGCLLGKSYLAHRVAWALYHGESATGQIDHKNRIRTDNSISNLRVATPQQNSWNMKAREAKSGYKGVAPVKGRWHAYIANGSGGTRNLGRFDTEIEAAQAYDFAAKAERGDFACLNFPSGV